MKFLYVALAGLLFSPVLSSAQSLGVNLTWTASTDSTVSTPGTVQVFRATGTCAANPTNGTGYSELNSIAPAAGPYLDQNVALGSTYCYYVTATIPNYDAPSAPSNLFQITVAYSTGPMPPTNLTGQVVVIGSNGSLTPAVVRPGTVLRRPSVPRIGPSN